MNRIQKVLSSAAVASLLAVMPLAASANTLNASSSTGVIISPSGIVRVIGADVTSVSNGVFNAVTSFGNVVMTWVVNVSGATNIAAGGSKTATTTDIKVGDKVSFAGTLSSSAGSLLSVAATKVRDITTFPFRHIGGGTISSVNSADGSFVITQGNRTVTVQTNASTTISVNGATSTFAALTTGEKVLVAGTPNADGSVITAATVAVKNSTDNKNDNDGDNDNHAKVGVNADVTAGANTKSDDSKGAHAGLNFLGGLHFGFGKDR